MYEVEGTKQMIPYSSSVVDGNLPKLDEKVDQWLQGWIDGDDDGDATGSDDDDDDDDGDATGSGDDGDDDKKVLWLDAYVRICKGNGAIQ